MRPILFTFFGRPVYSYPVLLYFAMVLGLDAQLLAARSVGIDLGSVLLVALLLLAVALAGARLLHVALKWRLYAAAPSRILRLSSGGASMYGGLVLSVAASPPLLAGMGIPFATFWDLAAFNLIVGMIVGRMGCFLHGCCAGRVVTWRCGVHLPNHLGVWRRRIPTQLLESAWSVVVLLGALEVWRDLPFDGAVFFWVVGGYAAGRAVLETARENPDRLRGLRVQRAISITLVGVAVFAFAVGT